MGATGGHGGDRGRTGPPGAHGATRGRTGARAAPRGSRREDAGRAGMLVPLTAESCYSDVYVRIRLREKAVSLASPESSLDTGRWRPAPHRRSLRARFVQVVGAVVH